MIPIVISDSRSMPTSPNPAPSVHIRVATPDDCVPMAQLHAASWRFAYRGALSDAYLAGDVAAERLQWWQSKFAEPGPGQHILLAENHGALCGFVCVYGNESPQWGCYLNNIHVAQSAQGLGIGARLMHATAAVCHTQYGEGGLYLWVLQSNTKAQGFYARLGGKNTGVDVWDAPDGTRSPLYRVSWDSVAALEAATAQPAH